MAPAAPLSFPDLSLVGSIDSFFYKPPTTSNKKSTDFLKLIGCRFRRPDPVPAPLAAPGG